MVRINVGINPKYLHDKHLGAEYNEILKLAGHVRAHPYQCKTPWPSEFTLGKGHINFFKNKLAYLERRWILVCSECRRRGRQVHPERFYNIIKCVPYTRRTELYNNWIPRQKDFDIIKARVVERCEKYGFDHRDLDRQTSPNLI